MKLYKSLAVFLIFTLLLSAKSSKGYPGSYLNMRVSATGKALGGTGVASPNITASMYSNPAGLSFLDNRQAEFNYFFLSLDREMNYIGYSTPIEPSGGVGIAWVHAGVDDIQGRNDIGSKTKKHQTGEDAFLISLSNSFSSKFSVGISAKILRNNMLDITGTGVGVDIGALYRLNPNFTIGLNIRDINSGYQWQTDDIFGEQKGQNYKEKFPLKGLIGLTWQNDNYLVSYDFEYTNKNIIRHHIGAGYQYNDVAYLRAGMDDFQPTFGGGVKYKLFKDIRTKLDYCFLVGSVGQGATHVFSWKFIF